MQTAVVVVGVGDDGDGDDGEMMLGRRE